jgi:HK97 gp10 family phage protein
MTVSMKIVNGKKFASNFERRAGRVSINLKKAVRQAATETRNTAVKSILQNPRAGSQVTRYNPTRTIKTSAAGDAPASDTGFLASNIHLIFKDQGFLAEVESRADYSAALEFGTIKMRARPFLQPALEEGRKKIKALFSKAVKSGMK